MSTTTRKRKNYPDLKYYALYLRKTDELVCSGSAKECAIELRITIPAFYNRVYNAVHRRNDKWDVYIEPYNCQYSSTDD